MIPEIPGCFESTLTFMRGQVADLSDAEMVLQPPGFPNHAAWTPGHVVYSCQAIAAEFGVGPWLPSDWESHFGRGRAPKRVASDQTMSTRSRVPLVTRGSCWKRCPNAHGLTTYTR
jgi:hypothetical protein